MVNGRYSPELTWAQGSSVHTMGFCLLETGVQAAECVHRSHRMGAMGDLEKVSCLLSCAGRGTPARHILFLADLQVGRDPGLTKGGGEDAARGAHAETGVAEGSCHAAS